MKSHLIYHSIELILNWNSMFSNYLSIVPIFLTFNMFKNHSLVIRVRIIHKIFMKLL